MGSPVYAGSSNAIQFIRKLCNKVCWVTLGIGLNLEANLAWPPRQLVPESAGPWQRCPCLPEEPYASSCAGRETKKTSKLSIWSWVVQSPLLIPFTSSVKPFSPKSSHLLPTKRGKFTAHSQSQHAPSKKKGWVLEEKFSWDAHLGHSSTSALTDRERRLLHGGKEMSGQRGAETTLCPLETPDGWASPAAETSSRVMHILS